MKKLRPVLRCLVVSGLATSAAACGAPAELEPGVRTQASVCGSTTDWEDVEPWAAAEGTTWANRINRAQRAVAQIRRRSTGSAICTGYLIAENLGLTAGHCFDSAEEAADYDFVFDYQLDSSGASRSTTTVQISEGLEHSTATGSDYALVRLASNAGATFGSIPVVNSLPSSGSTLGIVQHPLGYMKKFHDGSYSGLNGSGQLTYGDLDTDNGSSGSPVISSSYEVVGVHTNGGCSSSGGSNKATAMTDVYSLSTVIPKLVRIRAAGIPTPLGSVSLASTLKSCSRSGNYYDMANGCGLQVMLAGTMTATCNSGAAGHKIASFTASGAVMSTSCNAANTSCTGTFLYTGSGVDVTCRYSL